MSILTKYFCREFFKILVICLLVLIFMYLMIDFFERVDNFIEAKVPMGLMLTYFTYKIPHIGVQMLPPACLIAVIILFSVMKKNKEIISLRISGLSIWKFTQPIIIVSLFLATGLFLFSEIVVPYTSSRSNEIWRIQVQKRSPRLYYGRDHIWYKGSNCIYWIRHFDNEKMVMKEPTFYFFDPSFRLVKRVDGQLGTWKDDKWEIKDGIILEVSDDGGYSLKKFKKIGLDITETPDSFVKEEKKTEEMSYWHLRRFASRVRHEGYDATRYFVDLNIKISFPFIVVVMVLIGAPIALGERKGGTALSVTLGIALCFLYLVVLGVSRSFGFSGYLPPVLSAWLANGVFFLLGIYLMANVDR